MTFREYLVEDEFNAESLNEAKYKIKTTKAYFQAWKVEVIGTGRFFLIEYKPEQREWAMYELEEDGDIYGNKEWVEYFPNVKSAKYDLENGHVYGL